MSRQAGRKVRDLKIRDLGMFGLGAWGFIDQLTQEMPASPWVLGTCLALMGGPAVVNSVAKAIAAMQLSDTATPPSPSVPPQSSSDTSSSGTSN